MFFKYKIKSQLKVQLNVISYIRELEKKLYFIHIQMSPSVPGTKLAKNLNYSKYS
jgi:hypothetical protein